jgi:hypothetical protein
VRIRFERTGGVAGIPLACEVALDALPAHDRRHLEQLVDASDFFSCPASMTGASGADRFTYTISVERDARTHTVEVSDAATPPKLRPLITYLTAAARAG